MKVNITGKNFNTYDRLQETVEKKLDKLDKYFSDEATAKVVLSKERGRDKIEATINAKGAVFRAEEVTDDIYEGIDLAVDKLASQMSRFKGKLRKRYNDNKALKFEFMPEPETEKEEAKVVKAKKFQLEPMSEDEAVLQMEMLQHDFFVFLNMETDSVNVVYKRKDGNYGLLETTY
ncbi:ribosome hibernation-promoting factor, HPF/YfiA family [Hornefia butyriciproducens]|uniref:ribosome hibernation-promoting factor, HPF/YfiA family n=1 Tax=Hornefia butyriciproducens TaxID=2652293 RepID=UPI003F89B30C